MATKILTAAALVLGLSFSSVAFAGTPKTDTKDAKAPAKVVAKTATTNDVQAKDQSFTYYVIGEETVNGVAMYDVTTTNPGCKSTGTKPCEVISSQQATQDQIEQSAVTQVLSHRD